MTIPFDAGSKGNHAIKASDIWSLGVTIFELAMGELPFCGLGGSMQRQGAEIPDLSDNFSNDLNMVMQSCLEKEPWDRPTAQMLSEYAAKKVMGKDEPIPWLNNEESKESNDSVVSATESPDNNQLEKGTLLFTAQPVSTPSETETNSESEAEDPLLAQDDKSINKTASTRKIKWYVWVLAVIIGLSIGVVLNLFDII